MHGHQGHVNAVWLLLALNGPVMSKRGVTTWAVCVCAFVCVCVCVCSACTTHGTMSFKLLNIPSEFALHHVSHCEDVDLCIVHRPERHDGGVRGALARANTTMLSLLISEPYSPTLHMHYKPPKATCRNDHTFRTARNTRECNCTMISSPSILGISLCMNLDMVITEATHVKTVSTRKKNTNAS